MKKRMKFFKLIALFTLFSTLYSCSDDETLIENDSRSYDLKTSRVSINQVLNEISSKDIKQKLQNNNFDSTLSNSLLRSSESEVYFIKKEKDDELTTYILHLNSYSPLKPYFLKFIITKNKNETERIGYIKYIPINPTSTLDLATFSGEVQILGTNFEINSKSVFLNGVVQENGQNETVSNRTCVNEIEIREVKCSHSGNHGVGQSCGPGYVNDAHYVIYVFERCGSITNLVQIIEDSNSDGQGGGAGGGGGANIDELLSSILSPEENTWWNNATQEEKQPFLDYLNSNINNGESWLFVKEAIKAVKDGGEVDFENLTISDPEFKDSQLDCIHKKLKDIPNGLYAKMLAEFNDNTGSTLTFKIGTPPAGDWGITKGSADLPNNYTITIAQNVENGSNLMKTVTLSHELIHAYMFNSLEKANYLIFDSTGAPRFNSNLCNTSTNYQNIDLNTLNTADRLFVLLCGMQQAGTLINNDEWSHIIFNTATFDIVTYRQALENFIYTNHDWDNESTVFKNRAMNVFGNKWKRKVAQAASWIGLEKTAGYQNYINSHLTNIPQYGYIRFFKNVEVLDAKSDCL